MSHLCWGGDTVKEGRWRCVNQSIAVFYVWFDDVGKYGDEAEVGEVVKGVVGDGDWMCGFTTAAYNSDCWHKIVSPIFDDIR